MDCKQHSQTEAGEAKWKGEIPLSLWLSLFPFRVLSEGKIWLSLKVFWILHAKVGGWRQSETCWQNITTYRPTTPGTLVQNYSKIQLNHSEPYMFSKAEAYVRLFLLWWTKKKVISIIWGVIFFPAQNPISFIRNSPKIQTFTFVHLLINQNEELPRFLNQSMMRRWVLTSKCHFLFLLH